jgi:hypothetical protein
MLCTGFWWIYRAILSPKAGSRNAATHLSD